MAKNSEIIRKNGAKNAKKYCVQSGDNIYPEDGRFSIADSNGTYRSLLKAFAQGDMNALIASCSEYTTLTTGHRIDGMMFSCSSLGIKIGGAFGTALCGWLLDSAGFVENTTQNAATIGMLHFLYLWAPIIICCAVFLLISLLKVEKANEKLLEAREDKSVSDVYGNV